MTRLMNKAHRTAIGIFAFCLGELMSIIGRINVHYWTN